jgi:hypothetical protein
LPILHKEADIEKHGPGGGYQHGLTQADFVNQLRRNGEWEDQQTQKLERSADPIP